jgi:hypothetical protein
MTENEITKQIVDAAYKALNRLLHSDPPAAQKISEYRRIIAFRNFLIHVYHAMARNAPPSGTSCKENTPFSGAKLRGY